MDYIQLECNLQFVMHISFKELLNKQLLKKTPFSSKTFVDVFDHSTSFVLFQIVLLAEEQVQDSSHND